MRIGTNLHGGDFAALSNLNKVFQKLNTITMQLSTGMQINRGSDDPAGLAAIESLQSELAADEQASRNLSFAHYSMEIADAGMGQPRFDADKSVLRAKRNPRCRHGAIHVGIDSYGDCRQVAA
jgi:hypothetical protein